MKTHWVAAGCLWLGLLAPALGAPAPAGRPAAVDVVGTLGQDFSITEGNQVNWFLRNGDAASHVIVTNHKNPRVLVTYPAENAGTAVWFYPSANPGLDLTLASPPRVQATAGGEAVTMGLTANRATLEISEFALDSIRVLRNHQFEERGQPNPEGARELRSKYRVTHPDMPAAWATEQKTVEGTRVRIERAAPDGKGRYALDLDFPVGTRIEQTQKGFRITAPSAPLAFTLTSRVPVAPLHAYDPHALLRPEVFTTLADLDRVAQAPGASEAVIRDRDAFAAALRGLLFLSSRDKFMAGAWRFMTYFGRDTMISLMLLREILTPQAYADGIQSVLDRLAPNGDVAHEEDLGPFAEIRHIWAPKLPGALTDPVYDYKMIDDDFLLPIMEGFYFNDERVPREARQKLLSSRPDNVARILSNWEFVLGKAEAWARDHGKDYHDLVRIRPRMEVGNWRDSGAGLGGGTYPSDVNVDLVPKAVTSIREMVASGLFPAASIAALPRVSELAGMEGAWRHSGDRFEVVLQPADVRARLQAFLERAPIDDAQRAYFRSVRLPDGNTLEAFLAAEKTPPSMAAPLHFPALALDDAGHPVPVMNSDFGFRLFFQDPSPDEVSQLLRLVELPYPIGLMTPVGPVVANAAYSANPEHWRNLSRDSYHGAVIWSWQASLLESGLIRQFQRFRNDPSQAALARRLQAAIQTQIDARRAAGPLAGSELWTWDIKDGRLVGLAFGQREGSDTESNAVQLWSTIFPSLYLKEQGIRP